MNTITLYRRIFLVTAIAAIAIVSLLALLPHTARAALEGGIYTVYRTDDGPIDFGCNATGLGCTLRGAIGYANANPGSTLNLVHNSTYVLTNTALGQLDVTADVTITADFMCIGLFQCPAIIKGNPGWNTRILEIGSNAHVMLNSLTIRGGYIPYTSTGEGAGIYNSGYLTLMATTLYTNTTKTGDLNANGGGLANYGTLTVYGGSFLNNYSGDVGGGLFNAPGHTASIQNTTFSGNTSLNGGAIGNEGEVIVSGATLVSNQTPSAQGGAFYNSSNTHATLIDTSILTNSAYGGGGIINYGDLQLLRNTLQGNRADNIGGALASIGDFGSIATVAMTDTVLVGNSAQTLGGGILVSGDSNVQLYQSQVIQNAAATGGGLYYAGTQNLKIDQTLIATNTASSDGGGLFDDASTGSVHISQSDIRGNWASAGKGGGIYQAYLSHPMFITDTTIEQNHSPNGSGYTGGGGLYTNSDLRVWNSTFSANDTGRDGGAIKNNNGQIQLNNTTLSGNTAGRDGGGMITGGSAWVSFANVTLVGNIAGGAGGGISNTGQLQARNSLFSDNQGPGGGWDCAGTLTSNGYNLMKHTAGCAISGGGSTDITGYGGQVDTVLKDNGGPTWTHLLPPGSVAIDDGNPAGCNDTLGVPLKTDQRGMPRTLGTRCDIGAVEMGAVVFLPGILR